MISDSNLWCVWDEGSSQIASVAVFVSEDSANAQIQAWKDRQSRGGRPDVDCSKLKAITVEEAERRGGETEERHDQHDYPTSRMGGGNPYRKCRYCGISMPKINGRVSGHLSSCMYRQWKEANPGQQFPGAEDDER